MHSTDVEINDYNKQDGEEEDKETEFDLVNLWSYAKQWRDQNERKKKHQTKNSRN